MGGSPKSIKQLQKIYSYFIKILLKHNIDFILFYGTVLGIVRENDFICGDDDIDVIIDKKYYNKILKIISKYNICIGINNKNLIQLFLDDLGPFDIYFYEIKNNKIYIPWENDVYNMDLILPPKKINFYNYNVYIPNKSKQFVSSYYGYFWKIKNAPRITKNRLEKLGIILSYFIISTLF